MTQALAIQQRDLTVPAWEMIERVAPAMYAARFFGIGNKEQAAAVMLKGFELGLPLAASFEFIQVVEGRPTLSPRGALALVLRSGLLAKLDVRESVDSCTVTMARKGDPPLEYTTSWSIEDAKRAGLYKERGAWAMYPANMCRWRALGFAIDFLFSDVCGGLKRADEFGAAIDPQGDVVAAVEGEWRNVPTAEAAPEPTVDLDSLIDRYGADAVIAANGGTIPGTDADVTAVAARLGGG